MVCGLAKLQEITEAERAAAALSVHALICNNCIKFALRNPHNHHIPARFQQRNWLSSAILRTPPRFQSGYVHYFCATSFRVLHPSSRYVCVRYFAATRLSDIVVLLHVCFRAGHADHHPRPFHQLHTS